MEPTDASLPPSPSRRHWPCERCQQWVLPMRPHLGWRVGEKVVWVLLPLLIAVASKGPGLVLLPIVFMIGAAILGPLHGIAAAEARCPSCRRYVRPPAKSR